MRARDALGAARDKFVRQIRGGRRKKSQRRVENACVIERIRKNRIFRNPKSVIRIGY